MAQRRGVVGLEYPEAVDVPPRIEDDQMAQPDL